MARTETENENVFCLSLCIGYSRGSAAEDEKIEAFIGVTRSNRMAGACCERLGF